MRRAVCTVIRLIAGGLLVFGGMALGLELMRYRMQSGALSLWHCVFGTILLVLGVALFAASASLAKRLTDDVEE